MSVDEHRKLLDAEIVHQLMLEPLIDRAHVGQVMGFENRLDFLAVFLKRGHGRPCNQNTHVLAPILFISLQFAALPLQYLRCCAVVRP